MDSEVYKEGKAQFEPQKSNYSIRFSYRFENNFFSRLLNDSLKSIWWSYYCLGSGSAFIKFCGSRSAYDQCGSTSLHISKVRPLVWGSQFCSQPGGPPDSGTGSQSSPTHI